MYEKSKSNLSKIKKLKWIIETSICPPQQQEKIEVKVLQLLKQIWVAGITETFTESSG